MTLFRFAASLIVTASVSMIGCAASTTETDDGTSTTESTLTCYTDADCPANDACQLYCPVIPGKPHCEIAGGKCVSILCPWVPGSETDKSLSGHAWQSADTLVTYNFNSNGTFNGVKQPACTVGPVHCNLRAAPVPGTYTITAGHTVHLKYAGGASATLEIEKNCKGSEELTGTDFGGTVTVFPIAK